MDIKSWQTQQQRTSRSWLAHSWWKTARYFVEDGEAKRKLLLGCNHHHHLSLYSISAICSQQSPAHCCAGLGGPTCHIKRQSRVASRRPTSSSWFPAQGPDDSCYYWWWNKDKKDLFIYSRQQLSSTFEFLIFWPNETLWCRAQRIGYIHFWNVCN